MKNNQHEQLFTELTAESEAPAFQELDDEVAATCSGGALVLFEHGDYNQDIKGKNLKVVDSISNLGSFSNKTSSFIITEGRWEFYDGANYETRLFTYGPGTYPVIAARNNDKVTSVKRIA